MNNHLIPEDIALVSLPMDMEIHLGVTAVEGEIPFTLALFWGLVKYFYDYLIH
jgi:hypothetical protein